MVNAKDNIKSDKLSNIGHTLGPIRDANEVASSLDGIAKRPYASPAFRN